MYEVESGSITAVMNVYRRTKYFQEQLEAILNQSIKPKEIMIWINYHEDNQNFINDELDTILESYDYDGFRTFRCNHNWKYHGRFAGAQLAQSEYVCVFDDDTIPGSRWFENCLKTMRIKNGMMGAVGESYFFVNGENMDDGLAYHGIFGWRIRTPHWKRVDVIGHSWFFRKEWLKYLWMEEPETWDVAEDIQFSYSLQRYGNINSYVPPQPLEDDSLCGSLKGYEYGGDEVASYILNMDCWRDLDGIRMKAYRNYFDKGFKLQYNHNMRFSGVELKKENFIAKKYIYEPEQEERAQWKY